MSTDCVISFIRTFRTAKLIQDKKTTTTKSEQRLPWGRGEIERNTKKLGDKNVYF